MKKSTIGAFLLFLLGIICVLGYFYARPFLFEKKLRTTSDAREISRTIRIGGDNYLGYWFITAPEMRKLAARQGLHIDFTDDGGAYAERLEKFARDEYDCIVLPVNSYLQHGAKHKFPGVIVASISESRGADGIVGFADLLSSGKVNDLNNANLRFVYTGESPSSFLLDLMITDFDLFQLQTNDSWRIEVSGSKEVYSKVRKKEGDVFVLWEPDLSRALESPEVKYIWGSDKFSGYIIDVFVFHRNFLEKQRQVLRDFLNNYFRVLDLYGNNKEKMIQEMAKSANLKHDVVSTIIEKIDWFNLQENCNLQFGLSSQVGAAAVDGVINTIIACTDVLIKTNRMEKDPLQGNPFLITNSTILEELAKAAILPTRSGTGQQTVNFSVLEAGDWTKLREVGVLRVEPITFQSWDNLLDEDGKNITDKIAGMLVHNYPNYRIVVRGHTAPGGDETENQKLSRQRAQAVMQYLVAVHGINPNRLKAEGIGSQTPPPKKPGESPRAYQYRLSRVEFVAYEANPL